MDLRSKLPTYLQFAEIGVALALVGVVVVSFGINIVFGSSSDLQSHPLVHWFGVVLIWTMFFVLPLGLAGATLVSLVTTEIGIGSVLAGAAALLTLPVMLIGLLAYVTPGGGVMIAPFMSLAAGLFLALVVLVKPGINRVTARLWQRPRVIELS